jgi:hypothetical protein
MPIGFRYRLIDTAGGEIGIVTYNTPRMAIGDTVYLPDGKPAEVVEVYDDEQTTSTSRAAESPDGQTPAAPPAGAGRPRSPPPKSDPGSPRRR